MADEAEPGTTMTGPREIPAHDLVGVGTEVATDALVIPVVNEGERIRRQLRNIAALGLRVDVVIADGGSDDGSVAEEFLRQVGVRALLIKRGPGRPLGPAAHGLRLVSRPGLRGHRHGRWQRQGRPGAVDRFVGKLEDGYDLVQGSRYLPGGAAINTPLDRKLAGRLVHAPLVSWLPASAIPIPPTGFGAIPPLPARSAGLSRFAPCSRTKPSLLSLGTRASTRLSLRGDTWCGAPIRHRQDADQDPLMARALAHAARAGSRRGRGFQPSLPADRAAARE